MTTAKRQFWQVLIQSIVLMGFWIACVASLKRHEIIAGILATLFATSVSTFIIRTLPISFRPTLHDLAQAWRIPWYVITDLGIVIAVLVCDLIGKPASSLFRSIPYFPVSQGGEQAAKRALITAYMTISPNFVVIGIDRKRGQMLFHQLRPGKIPIMAQKLGAGSGGGQ